MNNFRAVFKFAFVALLVGAPALAGAQKAPRTVDISTVEKTAVGSGLAAGDTELPWATREHRNWGTLTDSDRVSPEGGRLDLWRLDVWNNEHIWVTVRSKDFDTFTVVFNPENRSISVENDDFETGSTDSRINMRSRGGGEYWIYVTSYAPSGRGRYSIDVQRAPSTP